MFFTTVGDYLIYEAMAIPLALIFIQLVNRWNTASKYKYYTTLLMVTIPCLTVLLVAMLVAAEEENMPAWVPVKTYACSPAFLCLAFIFANGIFIVMSGGDLFIKEFLNVLINYR